MSEETRFAFFKGEIVPVEKAKVSIRAHAFNYGTGCFEGIRGYWNEDERQLLIFRLHEHYLRLLNSCRILRISLPHTAEELGRITVKLLRKEGFQQDCYIRPLAYKGSPEIGLVLEGLQDELSIFATPFGKYIEKEGGASVAVSGWRRIEDSALPARAKLTGSYVSSALAKTEACLSGFDEAVLLTQDGHVSEGSSENLFMVRDGALITPPVSENILEGITRSSIIELARQEMGLDTMERRIDRTELYIAEEVFFTGTAAEVSPVIKIDHRPVGDGRMGPVTSRLRRMFFESVRGRSEAYRHWCTPVGG